MLFFDRASILDEIISWSEIVDIERQLKPVFDAIKFDPFKSYFFNHLSDNAIQIWWKPLNNYGFFKASPDPVEEDGTIRYPRWPEAQYLAKVLLFPDLTDEVISIAESIEVQNAFWLSDFIKSSLQIPSNYAPRIVDLVIYWSEKSMQLFNFMDKLFEYWAKNGEWAAFLKLLDFSLTTQSDIPTLELDKNSPFSPRAKFKYDEFFIERFLREDLSKYFDAQCLNILRVLEKNLDEAVRLEMPDAQVPIRSYWREAIEPSGQNMRDRCKDVLLNKTRDALDYLFIIDSNSAINIAEEYLTHPNTIFQRLALYIIGNHPDDFILVIPSLFENPRYWENLDFYHDYWIFTQKTYSRLSIQQQVSYVKNLFVDLDRKYKEENLRINYGIFRKIWAIKDQLPDDWSQKVFNEMKENLQVTDPEEFMSFLAYGYGVRWGSPSSVSSSEFIKMLPDEILEELKKTFSSDRKGINEPTIEGLSIELRQAVKSEPTIFGSISQSLFNAEIPPSHVANALRGFTEAWENKNDFNWEPVIELCKNVAKTVDEYSTTETSPDMNSNYWEDTYASARKAVIGLIRVAVREDEHAIPHEFLDDVHDILISLSDDINPSIEYEEVRGAQQGRGYIDLSLNVIRADAVQTLIEYALHRARIVNKNEQLKYLLPEGRRIETEIRDKLNEKLDKNNDPAKTVHLVFGLFLPNLNYLDETWLLSNLERIFPRGPEMIDYWEAAWDGFMFPNRNLGYLYPHLKQYYTYAIEQLELGDEGRAGSESSQKRLANHLAYLFVNGEEEFAGKNSLVERFFNIATDQLRANFVETLGTGRGRIYKKHPREEWDRMAEFWKWRFEFIDSRETLVDIQEELSAYLSWVSLIQDPLENFYKMIELSVRAVKHAYLLQELFSDLMRFLDQHTRFVIGLYEVVIQQDFQTFFWGAESDKEKIIIETAINSSDPETREIAIRVINLFGELRNDERYRHLLSQSK